MPGRSAGPSRLSRMYAEVGGRRSRSRLPDFVSARDADTPQRPVARSGDAPPGAAPPPRAPRRAARRRARRPRPRPRLGARRDSQVEDERGRGAARPESARPRWPPGRLPLASADDDVAAVERGRAERPSRRRAAPPQARSTAHDAAALDRTASILAAPPGEVEELARRVHLERADREVRGAARSGARPGWLVGTAGTVRSPPSTATAVTSRSNAGVDHVHRGDGLIGARRARLCASATSAQAHELPVEPDERLDRERARRRLERAVRAEQAGRAGRGERPRRSSTMSSRRGSARG